MMFGMNTSRKPRRRSSSARRVKRTFSLSTEALAYLELIAEKHQSVSEALDMLIRERRAQAEKERVSAGIRRYYDSISEEERAENESWGKFVLSHLAEEP
jgi:hypothetical protein